MSPENDGWVFYIDSATQIVEGLDLSFIGADYPTGDLQNDLQYEYIVTDDLVQIEVVRPFNTGDTMGQDIIFENGTIAYLMFASKDDHYEDRTIYYLSIQVSKTQGIAPSIKTPRDWEGLKLIVLELGMAGVIGFITVHFTVRGITRPLKHGDRIIDSNWKAPTFRERLHQITAPKNGNDKPTVDSRVKSKKS
jgi:hypothetical protein